MIQVAAQLLICANPLEHLVDGLGLRMDATREPNRPRTATALIDGQNRLPSSVWPCADSTSCGQCNETTPATNPKWPAPLDNLTETHCDVLASSSSRSNGADTAG